VESEGQFLGAGRRCGDPVKPTRDVMVYGSYTRGYKPRAFNTVHDFATPQTAPSAADLKFTTATKRETIDSFELGLKSSLLDRHLTFNLAAYYTKYNNYQAQLFDNSGLIAVLVLANADARTQGVEGDLTYVRGNTRFNLSGAYTDAKFTSFPGAVCYPGQTAAQGCNVAANSQDLTGKPLPSSPKFKLTGSVQQTVPLDRFNVLLGGNVSYRTSTNMQADQNPYTVQGGFALVDLSLGFQNKAQTASLTFFVNNLTNHMYYSNIEDFFASATSANLVIGQPARDRIAISAGACRSISDAHHGEPAREEALRFLLSCIEGRIHAHHRHRSRRFCRPPDRHPPDRAGTRCGGCGHGGRRHPAGRARGGGRSGRCSGARRCPVPRLRCGDPSGHRAGRRGGGRPCCLAPDQCRCDV
jgi:hypothetical protein